MSGTTPELDLQPIVKAPRATLGRSKTALREHPRAHPEPLHSGQRLTLPQLRPNHQHLHAGLPFLRRPIDHAAATSSAEAFGKLNQSISDASYLRIMAIMAGAFFLLMFVPFLSMAGSLGFVFLEFAIPFMSARWWMRFGKLQSADPELRRARRTALWVSILGALLLLNFIGGQIMRHLR